MEPGVGPDVLTDPFQLGVFCRSIVTGFGFWVVLYATSTWTPQSLRVPSYSTYSPTPRPLALGFIPSGFPKLWGTAPWQLAEPQQMGALFFLIERAHYNANPEVP